MKSLILKDLYNISHNMKSLLFILVFLAIALVGTGGVEGYIVASSVICTVMVITTFVFDETCKWNRYALVMPVSKSDIVLSKYVVALIFCGFGVVMGLICGLIIGSIMGNVDFSSSTVLELAVLCLAALSFSMVIGGMLIPLVIKFGSEKGRLYVVLSTLVPVAVIFVVFKLMNFADIVFTDELISILACCSPVAVLIWNVIMYKISCKIFEKQDI